MTHTDLGGTHAQELRTLHVILCACVCVGVLYGRVGREKQKWHNVLEY